MVALREDALKDKRPFDYDARGRGLRALDRYTLQIRVGRAAAALLCRRCDRRSCTARWRAKSSRPTATTIMAHPVGTGPFLLADWRRSSKIVLERNPTYRDAVYDARTGRRRRRGAGAAARAAGRKLPMIDRVEVSIIEETQPRWLAFLNQRAGPARATAVGLRRTCRAQRQAGAATSRGSDVQMSANPQCRRRLTRSSTCRTRWSAATAPEKVALRRAIGAGHQRRPGDPPVLARPGSPGAVAGLMPHTIGYDPAFRQRDGAHRPAARQGAAGHVRLRRSRRRRLARTARRLAAGARDGRRPRTSCARQRDEL